MRQHCDAGLLKLERAGHELRRVTAMAEEGSQKLQDEVYSLMTEQIAISIRSKRHIGWCCAGIGSWLASIHGGTWDWTKDAWAGYFACEAASRFFGEWLDTAPWRLGNGHPD